VSVIPEVLVKLSAPPPPPPVPEQPEPIIPAGEESAPAAAPPIDPPPSTSKPLGWPAWFSPADFLLATLAITLAFLVASFIARNSDVWVHLAAGKRLLTGEYRPGTDPFSYTGADRTWVNHNLIYDVGTYLLFRADPTGAVLVVVKALLVALTFGLLLGIRRPGFALWPWAAVAVIAILAVAPRLLLSPIVGSMFFLAVTLFLLFRMPMRANSWRFPIVIGITFWLWANIDGWFFIGPLVLGLVLIGELVQSRLLGRGEGAGATDPLGAIPDVPTLAKTLAIGIVACMLNPHHVRIWELPFELVGGEELKLDRRIKLLLLSPLSPEYTRNDETGRALGYNLNGLAYGALFVGGGLLLGFGAGRLRLAHLALWAGFGLLSLTSIFAIPFFAIVSVPILASQLNAISSRFSLKSWGDPKSRFLLFGSTGGRGISLLVVIVLCVLAWPGWLHPGGGIPSLARRVAWGLYSDDAMVRAAGQLQSWRDQGQLPPHSRGFIASVELANYCAWFAPQEKVFLNSRYKLHRQDLPDYIAVRKGIGLIPSDQPPNPEEVGDLLQKYKTEYVAVYGGPEDGTGIRTENVAVYGGPGEGMAIRGVALDMSVLMWSDTDRWSPWYLNGRTSISGWRSAPGQEHPTFAALRVDPVVLAFGPNAERLSAAEVRPIPQAMGWEEEFVRGVNVSPAGVDEAIAWHFYGQYRGIAVQNIQFMHHLAFLGVEQGAGGRGLVYLTAMPAVGAAIGKSLNIDELQATPFLALRAARRAIATDPNHPDGYFALSIALTNRMINMSEDEQATNRITALRQYLMRVPAPEHYRKGTCIFPPSEAAHQLAMLYLSTPLSPTGPFRGYPVNLPAFKILSGFSATGYVFDTKQGPRRVQASPELPPQFIAGRQPFFLPLDVAREMLVLAEKYAAVDSRNTEEANARVEAIQKESKLINKEYEAAKNAYELYKLGKSGAQLRLPELVREALRHNLAGEALRLLTDKDVDLRTEYKDDVLSAILLRVALELATGRLEDAASDLEVVPAQFDELAADPQLAARLHAPQLRSLLQMMTYLKLALEGNYTEAGSLMERLQGDIVGQTSQIKPPSEPSPIFQINLPIVTSASARAVAEGAKNWCITRVAMYENAHRLVMTTQARESEFFFRRGLVSLIEGDIPTAKKRFEQSVIPAVKSWDVPEFHNPQAERYLRLIRQAEHSGK